MNHSHPARKKLELLLVIAFCLVQTGLLLAFGIYTQEEAAKYVYEAGYFTQHGTFSQPKYVFYSGYIFLHILSNAVHAGFAGVYAVQLLLNAFATYCFYRLALQTAGNKTAAFIGTLLLILCIPFQKWTVYLFTESVFFSLMIIYCYVLFKPYRNVYAKLASILLLLLLLVIARPTGMLAIPATIMLASLYLFRQGRKLLAFAIWVPGLLIAVWLADTAMKGKGEFDFILPLVEEHIICGLTNRDAGETWYFYEDGKPEESSFLGLIAYAAQNFTSFVRLAFMRLGAFFALVRPYYSELHNFLLVVGFYPMYVLAVYAVGYLKRHARPFLIFSLTLIATFAFSVMLTCDDWHNRFIMPVMPLILLYAGMGATQLYNRMFKKKATSPG
ncbi:MAG TPA: hypothetical protein VD993_01415 [Chitinophagaceae bacterium]|nr:hypothetical protein [Chitinophagaceae bacterium]